MNQIESLKNLMQIPGVGKSISKNLLDIGINSIEDLKDKDPEILYIQSNTYARETQDRCLLYAFRCAVYFAETNSGKRDPEKLKWWNWKDTK